MAIFSETDLYKVSYLESKIESRWEEMGIQWGGKKKGLIKSGVSIATWSGIFEGQG